MDLQHPQLEKRNFFRVYNSGSGIWSFIYSVLAALYSGVLHRNVIHYKETYHKFLRKLDLTSLRYQKGSIKDIKTFLKQNKFLDISIVIYEGRLSPDSNQIQVWKYGKLGVGKNEINVLHTFIFKNGEKLSYYFYIKNILTIHHFFQKKYPCLQCFERFTSKERLNNHLQKCTYPQVLYPKKGTLIQYDKKCEAKYNSPLSIVGFADFETKLSELSTIVKRGSKCVKCSSKICSHISYTKQLESHELISYSLIFIDAKSTLIYEKHYCGSRVEENFFNTLVSIEEQLLLKTCSFKGISFMKPLTKDEKIENHHAAICCICKQKFDPNNRLRVKNRHHSHFSGNYLGAACTYCNLLSRSQREIPILFHNFKGYDSKIIMSCIQKSSDIKAQFNILSSNTQNFRSIRYHCFRFCDSLEHMPVSLEKLVNELNTCYSTDDFKIMKQSITLFKGNASDIKLKLLCCGKGIYPYQLANHYLEMEKIKTLPKQKYFYNHLQQKSCTDLEYLHAKKVWSEFRVKNLKEYTMIYNHCDVLLLAEAFYLYRRVILKSFDLDPSHFYGIPTLSFNIMLKYSKIKLDHLSDSRINDFFRHSIRGGVCFIKKRYEKGEWKFRNQGEQKFIKYLDATNLYGSMMLQKLPYKNFKILNFNELQDLERKLMSNENVDVDGNVSYFLEVDLDYPPYLHKIHEQYPLAPENFTVTYEDLSFFSRIQLSCCDSKKFKKASFSETKLIPHFHARRKYSLHIKNLLYYLKKGLILKKVHFAVKFRQKAWLKKYITHVASLRRTAKENNQDFFGLIMKIIANNTFGKFAQNPEKYVHIEIARTAEQLRKLSSSPNFLRHKILSENLVLVEMVPDKFEYKFQYAVASTILEFSKLHMYKFFYDTLIPHFHPDIPELMMTDTDSLVFSIKCSDFISRYQRLPLMDFSNYPKDHCLYNDKNKMKLGYFKDEFPGHYFITEFIGLRAKLYAYRSLTSDGQFVDYIKAKGYNSHAARRNLTFQRFLTCLQTFQNLKLSYLTFRGYDHSLFTIEQYKNVLSNFDSKVFVHSCNVHTSFYGSVLTKENSSSCYLCSEEAIKFPYRNDNFN